MSLCVYEEGRGQDHLTLSIYVVLSVLFMVLLDLMYFNFSKFLTFSLFKKFLPVPPYWNI